MALPININELINGHTVEWDRIEFKKGWNPEDIIHSLCAFANDINNWDGGYIILGLAEKNGMAELPPVGMHPEQIDAIQKKLIEISNRISPTYFPISQPFLKDGKHIFIIRAPGGDNRPYNAPVSLSEKKSERAYYIKRGSKTIKIKAGSDEERKLLELAARIPFDDRINQQAIIDDLELGLIQSHLKEILSSLYDESTKISFPDLCKQMQIVKGSEEFLRPTNAGLLIFSSNPHRFMPGAKIELVIHKEKAGKNYEEKIFSGPVVSQIRNVLDFIKTNIISEHVTKVPDRAESVRFYNYPYQAIEEAVVNAVYHKSYERENPVEIQIFPDQMEILSFPGPMPPVDNKMLQKERVVAREYRNRKIGGFLKELKLTEGRGTGIPIIYNELEKNGSPPPIFETDKDRSYFLCTIKIHPLVNQPAPKRDEDRAKDGVKDKALNIKTLGEIDSYLRSSGDQRWAKDKNEIIIKIGKTVLSILKFCIEPKSREEIFEFIKLYNNSKNYNKHIKPLVELGWLQLTLPDKPTSRYQTYITSGVAKMLIESQTEKIKRIPVTSSNIASIGYNAKNKTLEIEFTHGGIFRYLDVPEEEYEGLMNASSIESYYYHNIKNYNYIKL